MIKEIKPLTGVRGIAAVIVTFYHFFEHDPFYQNRIPSLIAKGYLGVDIFFVLSGFVMALSYANYFKTGLSLSHYKIFIAKRIARVYPLYFFITVIFSIKYLLDFSGTARNGYGVSDFVANLLMLQGWGFGFTSVAGATWSLSTEFFVYIIFPFLVLATIYRRKLYALLVLCAAAGLLYVISISGLGVSGALDVVSADSVMPLFRCLAGFCFGLLTFKLTRVVSISRLFSRPFFLIFLLVGFLAAEYLNASDLILFAFFPPLILVLYFQSVTAMWLFANKIVYHLGIISYSIYLVHPLFVPVKNRLEPLVESRIGILAHDLILLLVTFLTWGCACLLYRFVELKGRLYLQKFFVGRADKTDIKPLFDA